MATKLSTLLLSLALFSACNNPDHSSHTKEKDIAIIEKMREKELSAVLTGDVGALMDLRTEDFTAMLPGLPAIKGKEAVREVLTGMFDQMDDFKHATFTEEITVEGNLAYHRGTFRDEVVMKGNPEVIAYEGKFVWILKKQADGSWKYALHISNKIRDL